MGKVTNRSGGSIFGGITETLNLRQPIARSIAANFSMALNSPPIVRLASETVVLRVTLPEASKCPNMVQVVFNKTTVTTLLSIVLLDVTTTACLIGVGETAFLFSDGVSWLGGVIKKQT